MSFPHFYPNLKTSQDDWVRRVALSGDEVFVGTASSGIRRHVLGAVEARQVFRVQGTPGVPGPGGDFGDFKGGFQVVILLVKHAKLKIKRGGK